MESVKVIQFLKTDNGGYGYGAGYGNGNGNGRGYGDGDGSGNGYGSGSGNGRGNGYGSGSGYGAGYGNGNGYGRGNGYGSGSGYGSGYGYGYGDGSGYGDGDGSGIKSINGHNVHNIDGIPTIITHIHGNVAKGYTLRCNVYLKPCYVVKGNGYFAHGETIREAQAAIEEKVMADLDIEERIKRFKEGFKLGVKYPAKDFYKWHNLLTGSCEFGRRAFAEKRGIDIETAEYTVEEFINLTKDSFGGTVIRQLADEMEVKI